MNKNYTSQAYLKDISALAARYRVDLSLKQTELAEKAGISVHTVSDFENAKDISLERFIKILMVLGLDENLQMLIPDVEQRPSVQMMKVKGKMRQRAGRKVAPKEERFRWGDEE